MVQKFTKFITQHSLVQPGESILLAVSGGVDSVVMAELFHRTKFHFGIIHCNFNLRGEESDDDARFVEKLAQRTRARFFVRKFSTVKYAEEKHISIQMAARELRYTWFEEVRKKEGYASIATAHHLDDQIETFFINLLRGTGISGLHGILPRQGHLIRPILCFYRQEIESFVSANHLTFREDSSNQTVKYLRNRIRHQLIPLIRDIQPEYAQIITSTIQKVRDAETIRETLIESRRNELIHHENERILIRIDLLKTLKPLHAWLYELLSPYGFNESVLSDLIRTFDQDSGKTFYSSSYRLVKDREYLILDQKKPDLPLSGLSNIFTIEAHHSQLQQPVGLTVKKTDYKKEIPISGLKTTATLDFDKLSFPLTIRKWQPGDAFYPYGLNKRKKISDYLIDEKVAIPDKENTWVICSGSKIIWLVGHRIDHRFRVTRNTARLFIINQIA